MPLATRSRSRVRYVPGDPLPAGEVVMSVLPDQACQPRAQQSRPPCEEPSPVVVPLLAGVGSAQWYIGGRGGGSGGGAGEEPAGGAGDEGGEGFGGGGGEGE